MISFITTSVEPCTCGFAHQSWRVISTYYVKVIRLKNRRQTCMTLHICENPEGPRIHVGFVFFCELSYQRIW